LDINTLYHFQLVLHTTAGSFSSNVVEVQTHTMSNTSGISVCFGNVQDPQLLETAKIALDEMGAKWSDKIQIDTTHFVCTTPAATPTGAQASGSSATAPGVEYQRALQLSIPVVQPYWILACRNERK
jgi:chitin biosynthesis protein CHS5